MPAPVTTAFSAGAAGQPRCGLALGNLLNLNNWPENEYPMLVLHLGQYKIGWYKIRGHDVNGDPASICYT